MISFMLEAADQSEKILDTTYSILTLPIAAGLLVRVLPTGTDVRILSGYSSCRYTLVSAAVPAVLHTSILYNSLLCTLVKAGIPF